MKIRIITQSDNQALAIALRKVLVEMGVPKTGTAYEDKELDAMFEAYQNPHSVYYVIEHNEQLLGGAGISPLREGADNVCELQKMYFLPEARGKGMGKKMISLCLDFAQAEGFEKCYIETMPNMEVALQLYLKSGFTYIDTPLGNTGHTSCPIWMLKVLK